VGTALYPRAQSWVIRSSSRIHWLIQEFEKGGHMASTECEPIMMVWGLCPPQWGPEAKPLVREAKLNVFL